MELESHFLLLFFLQQIVGLNTNISFLSSLCEHGHFKAGDVHTDFIKVSSNKLVTTENVLLSLLLLAILVKPLLIVQEKKLLKALSLPTFRGDVNQAH